MEKGGPPCSLSCFYGGDFLIAQDRSLTPCLLMGDDMAAFALMTADKSVIATSPSYVNFTWITSPTQRWSDSSDGHCESLLPRDPLFFSEGLSALS